MGLCSATRRWNQSSDSWLANRLYQLPTIVLHGEGDGVHPPERSEGQEKLFSGYYERWLIPHAGHLFPREAPDAVIAAVQKLARLSTGTEDKLKD